MTFGYQHVERPYKDLMPQDGAESLSPDDRDRLARRLCRQLREITGRRGRRIHANDYHEKFNDREVLQYYKRSWIAHCPIHPTLKMNLEETKLHYRTMHLSSKFKSPGPQLRKHMLIRVDGLLDHRYNFTELPSTSDAQPQSVQGIAQVLTAETADHGPASVQTPRTSHTDVQLTSGMHSLIISSSPRTDQRLGLASDEPLPTVPPEDSDSDSSVRVVESIEIPQHHAMRTRTNTNSRNVRLECIITRPPHANQLADMHQRCFRPGQTKLLVRVASRDARTHAAATQHRQKLTYEFPRPRQSCRDVQSRGFAEYLEAKIWPCGDRIAAPESSDEERGFHVTCCRTRGRSRIAFTGAIDGPGCHVSCCFTRTRRRNGASRVTGTNVR